MKSTFPAWLDSNHPNYKKWKRARELSEQRGKFVESVLLNEIDLQGLCILDLGSGEGGTSQILSNKNKVISFDISYDRLHRQGKKNFQKILGDSQNLPFTPSSFDIIILQDVIEHLPENKILIDSLHLLLKEKGVLYLSTPNKLSLLNIIADPHFGFPFIALMKRKNINKYFLKYFREKDYNRKDIAELLSLNRLLKLFNHKFESRLFTVHAVKELFKKNEGIIWSNYHLRIVGIVNSLKINRLLKFLTNDGYGFVNKIFTPTFYFILTKKHPH